MTSALPSNLLEGNGVLEPEFTHMANGSISLCNKICLKLNIETWLSFPGWISYISTQRGQCVWRHGMFFFRTLPDLILWVFSLDWFLFVFYIITLYNPKYSVFLNSVSCSCKLLNLRELWESNLWPVCQTCRWPEDHWSCIWCLKWEDSCAGLCHQLWNLHTLWAVSVRIAWHAGTPQTHTLKKFVQNWQLRVITNYIILTVDVLIFIICSLCFWKFSSGTCLDMVTALPILNFFFLSLMRVLLR